MVNSVPTSPASAQIKKEYPSDTTLPNINSGIYVTDEFRMYAFKVMPCSRAYSHDWTDCPFVHPGENARRRDPKKYSYTCVPCPEFRKGFCGKGDECEYAHGVFESWLHPSQYRTRLCKDEVGCGRRVCFFAHRREELRSVDPSAASLDMISSSPKSTAVSAAAAAAGMWMNQKPTPNSQQLPNSTKSRLMKSTTFTPRSTWSPTYSDQYSRQLLGGSELLYSPSSSSSRELDQLSVARAIIMNAARSEAFAMRSQSFSNNRGGGMSTGWGSPEGKPDWGIRGEELNKMRKSTSFAMRNSPPGFNVSPPRKNIVFEEEEPDLSWVNSLVIDKEEHVPKHYGEINRSFGRSSEMFNRWGEQQIYLEHDHLVA